MIKIKNALITILFIMPSQVFADIKTEMIYREHNVGKAAIWIFANLHYAGLRAQNSSNKTWRIISFIFGFPGTLLSYFFVEEGKERMYGVDMPKNSPSEIPNEENHVA